MAQRKAPTPPAPKTSKAIQARPDRKRTDGSILLVAPDAGVAESARTAGASKGVPVEVVDSVSQVAEVLGKHPVRLVIASADSKQLMPILRDEAPDAQAIFVDETPSVDRSITAFRAGFLDYLSADDAANPDKLADRVDAALDKQHHLARTERRLGRLRSAVRKLNSSRREVGKRVDVLCNDLISAYTDLARQMDTVRLRQEFGALLEDADDLEQLLCHTMDWILKRMGHCNIAIYLTSENGCSELGAYMKYTIAGDLPLTQAMADGLVKQIQHRSYLHADATSLPALLTTDELSTLQGQTVLGVDCQYLAESLATIICFRDGRKPFTAEDREALECAAGPFAQVLTSLVSEGGPDDWSDEQWPHLGDSFGDDEFAGDDDWPDDGKQGPDDRHAADWWKNGGDAPF
ncbi:MAG: hypothetical protein AAGD32_02025 [Planctomycetota bacterium]